MSRGWLRPRAAVIPVIGTAVALSLTALTGPAAQAASPASSVTAAAASITVSPQQAGLDEMMKSYGLTHLIGTSWWQAAIAQSTLETYELDTGDTTYSGDIADTWDLYHLVDPSLQPDFEDHFIDDTGWWGVAWLQAYLMTGDSSYLQTAEADLSYMHQYWNTDASACGGVGGVWWEVTSSGPAGRVAISNELFLELSAWLYNVTGNSTYLSWAEAEWSWFQAAGFITSSNLVYDNFNSACQLIAPYFTYNQGVILAGLSQLYLATKNASLLTQAENIATAAIAKLAPSGVLADTCQPSSCDGDMTSFKGIFVRNLRMLATIAGTTQYNSFLSAQAASIEAHDTNANNQMGLNWSASLPACPAALTAANPCNSQTQVAAEDALVAALGRPPVARPAAVLNSSGTVWAFARVTGGGLSGGSLEADSLAKGATSWSGFTSLGGATPYSPAAVAASNGDTRVFVVGVNGNLYDDALPAGSSAWSGWSSLGSPGGTHLIGTPAVVQDSSGVIRAFIRAENGNLYTDSLSGSTWSGFSDLGGTWPSDVAALVGSSGYVHVFAVGTTGNLYHDQLPPGGSWSGWGDLGGEVTGVPAVAQDSAGTMRAYAREVSGGALLEYYANSGSTSYATDTHSGAWPYDEAAVATSGTRAVSLFGVGSTGNAYWQYLTTKPSWSSWNDLTGGFTGVPAAVNLGSGDIDLFADAAGSLEVDQLSGSTWSGWSALGGNLS
jgi:predicted alpha-1,6-mannanase (GH76 family)